MRTVASLPYEITESDHVWIPVSDGIRLSARIWRPVASDGEPVPAILEYIPYRHRDLTSVRDSVPGTRAAGRGRGARVDRGAAVVHRPHGDDGDFLGRIRRPASGRAQTAEPDTG